MQPVYVGELFRLLELVGMEWQVVGKRLGAPRTPLSLWRHGRRPISRAYAGPLVRLTIEAVNHAIDRAKTEDALSPPQKAIHSLLSQPLSRASALESEIWECIHRWDVELYHTTGRIDEDTMRWLDVLSEYRQRAPSKLESFDLQRIVYAANLIKRNTEELQRWRGEDGPSVGIHWPSPQTPADRLAEIARAVGIMVNPEAEP